jgi:hypothetical protein
MPFPHLLSRDHECPLQGYAGKSREPPQRFSQSDDEIAEFIDSNA